jgi:hypothetical protein
MTINIVRFLIFTFIIVNSASAQSRNRQPQQSRAPQADSPAKINKRWFNLISPDEDFVIEFPARPEREADSEATSGAVRHYVLQRPAIIFQLSYVDSGFEPNDRESNQFPPKFSQEMIEHAKHAGADVLRSQLLRINVYELEIMYPRKDDRNLLLHSVERYLIRYGRQYTLTCASIIPNRKVDERICHRFFNSFRILNAPKAQ